MEFTPNSLADRFAHYLGIVHKHAKDHFIPHEGNGHVPHLLKHRVLLGYSAVVVLLKVLVVLIPIALPSTSLYSNSITIKNVIELTNATREKLGLPALKENAVLNSAAGAKAQDMITNGYFAHTSPTGVTAWTFIKQNGYAYKSAGENLAVHYTTAEGLHEGWMASPTHKANIVSTKYDDIGVGIVQGEYGGYNTVMVVQLFGKPASAPATTAVAPAPAPATAPAPAPAPTPTPAPVAVAPEPEPVPVAVAPAPAPVVNAAPAPVEQPKAPATVAGVTTPKPAPVKEAPAVVVAEPAPAPLPEPLAFDASSVLIIPGAESYTVEAAMTGVATATLTLGTQTAALTPVAGGRWAGAVAYDKNAVPEGGEELFLLVVGKDGTTLYEPLAVVAPEARTHEIYAFANDRNPKTVIAGVSVDNLDDDVRRFYVYAIVFLAGGVLISLLYRVHRKRMSIVAHTLVVILLTVIMLKF